MNKADSGEAPFARRESRQILVGKVPIGGDAPVSVQSMTTTKTADAEATLTQIYGLASAGVDIVRVTCNDEDAAAALPEILARSPVPIIADIHFQHRLALAALEAGVDGLRLNPGNIRKPKDIRAVAREAIDRRVPIRVGVNAGSLDKDLYEKHGGVTPEALVESALHEVGILEGEGLDAIKISVKASNVPLMIKSYRLLAKQTDYPLHLGVTEAGPPPAGTIKCVAGIATLLAEGIGDTIRFSLTAEPVDEVRAGRTLVETLGLRERRGLDLVACPSCGRAEVDVIKLANKTETAFADLKIPLQVAVMGCVVNGPGEAREADIGLASGRSGAHLFIKGEVVRVLKVDKSAADPYDEMVRELVNEAERLMAQGIEARLEAAEAGAAALAEAEAEALRESDFDPNHTLGAAEHIREVVDSADSD